MKSAAALILLLGLALSVEAVGVPVYQYPEEWGLWKSTHAKKYESDLEELERHSVWLSNKEYIDQHNANAELFGFTLAMNHLGDLVSVLYASSSKPYSCFPLSYQTAHHGLLCLSLSLSLSFPPPSSSSPILLCSIPPLTSD